MSDNQKWSILQGDALKVLGTFAPNTFDAVITDPPYASGGRTQTEKNKSTARKYSSMGENAPPPFDGDAKDQRSWTRWAAEWLYEARKVCKSGAPVCMFIDWRQLPAATDALQWAGWIWRGTAVWDKGNSRPQKGRFRQQAEYIVWGSNGDMPISRPVPCLPGVFKYGAGRGQAVHQFPDRYDFLHCRRCQHRRRHAVRRSRRYYAANKKDPVAAGSGVCSDLRHHGGGQRFPPFQNAGRIGEGTPCHGIRFSIPL